MSRNRQAFPTSHVNPGMNLVEYYAGQFLAGEASNGLLTGNKASTAVRAFDFGEAMAAEAAKRRK